jgi:hypothetical protein
MSSLPHDWLDGPELLVGEAMILHLSPPASRAYQSAIPGMRIVTLMALPILMRLTCIALHLDAQKCCLK